MPKETGEWEADADVLLAVRLDRASRSVVDFAAMMQRAERGGWVLTFTATAIGTTDASGRFSARTREGMQQRKAEGARFGREVDADFLPTYRRVLDMHSGGASLNAIARILNAEAVPPAKGGKWYPSTVRTMVSSETARTLGLET